jgi:iron complex outermembrane receptor protein
MRTLRRIPVWFCMLVATLPPAGLVAQTGADITGTVMDEAGGLIAGVKVTLLDGAGVSRGEAATNTAGTFRIPGVARGSFNLRFEQKNFETTTTALAVTEAAPPELHIVLRVSGTRQELTVSETGAYVTPEANSATKLETPIMETPVSVQVIPQQVMIDQQTVRLDGAIENVSGVIRNNDAYGTNDSFSIRGFDAQGLTYEDGLRLDQYSTAGFPIDMANIEKVEVVKGPASVMYGQAEPGGAVSITTKKPLDTPFYSLQQEFGSHGFYRTVLDATGPVFGKHFFYRIPIDYENSGSYRDFVFTHWFSMFPSLAWRPNSQTQVIATFHYASGTMVLDNGIPFLSDGTPANIPMSRNLAEPNTNRSGITEYSGKILASHEFRKNWQVRLAYRSQYIDNSPSNSLYYSGDADAQGNLQRYGFTGNYFYHLTNHVVADVTGQFTALGMKHSLLAGFDYYEQDGHYDANVYLPASINIYQPVYGQPYAPPDPANDFFVHNGQSAYGFYVQDQVTLLKNLHLLAGVRFNWVNTFNTGYGQATSVTDHPSPTPRVGLLWQPKQQLSIYGSFTENYGATPLGSLTPDGKTLPPQSAQQFEVGVKSEWLQKRLVATASIYQITKQNIPSADPANPAYSIAVGEARSRGLEFDVSGQISPGWRMIGGYSYIDARITKDTNSPSLQGLRFPDAPFDSGHIWTVYEVQHGGLKGLKFGAGVIGRTGQQNYESPDGVTYLTDRIQGWAVVNMMAGYTWRFERVRLVAQLNINNLSDKTYFVSVNPSQALPGAPITVLPLLRLEF